MTPDDAAELEARVRSLEIDLAVLQTSVHESIRTRSIVVIDEDGHERVVLDARHRTGSVLVCIAGPNGQTTGIELYAAESEADPPEVGWCLIRDGDVVSRWSAS